jgi:integrase
MNTQAQVLDDSEQLTALIQFFMDTASGFERRQQQLAPRTLINYDSLFSVLMREGQTPIDRASTKSAYSTHMAAWRFGHTKALIELGRDAVLIRQKIKAGEIRRGVDDLRLREIIHKSSYHLDCLAKAASAPDPARYADKKKRSANSAKHKNSKLKPDWRDRMLQLAIDSGSKYSPTIALLSATGCRPAEIEKGIKCTVKGNGIQFEIPGAKTHGGKFGQEKRVFTSTEDTLASRYLRKYLAQNKTIEAHAHKITDTVAKMGRRLYSRANAIRPTAYSFRHALASDLKALGYTREDVAGVLGHYSTTTQRYYAAATSHPSTRGIQDIRTTKEIVSESIRPLIAAKMAEKEYSAER